MREQAIGAAIGVIVTATLGILGDSISNGWLVRQLEGATQPELADVKKQINGVSDTTTAVAALKALIDTGGKFLLVSHQAYP